MEFFKNVEKSRKSRFDLRSILMLCAVSAGITAYNIYDTFTFSAAKAQSSPGVIEPYLDPLLINKQLTDFLNHETQLEAPVTQVQAAENIIGQQINSLDTLRAKAREYYASKGDIQNVVSGLGLFDMLMDQRETITDTTSTLTFGQFDVAVNGDGDDCIQGVQLGDKFPGFLPGVIAEGESYINGMTSKDHGKLVLGTAVSLMSNKIQLNPVVTVDAYSNVFETTRNTDYNNLPSCVKRGYTEAEFNKLVASTPITEEVKLNYGSTSFEDAFAAMYDKDADLMSISLTLGHNSEGQLAYSEEMARVIWALIKKNPDIVISFSAGNNGNDPYDMNGDGTVTPDEGTDLHWYAMCRRFPNNVIINGAINHDGTPTYFTAKKLNECGVTGVGEEAFTYKTVVDRDNNGIEDEAQSDVVADDGQETGDVKYILEMFRGTSASQPVDLGIISNIMVLKNAINAGEMPGLSKVNLTPVQIIKSSTVLPFQYREGEKYDPKKGTHSQLGLGYADLFNAQIYVLDKAGAFGRDDANLTAENIKYRGMLENWFENHFQIRPDKELSWAEIFRLLDNRLSVADYLEDLGKYKVYLPQIANGDKPFFVPN